jgi:hypothetical protein
VGRRKRGDQTLHPCNVTGAAYHPVSVVTTTRMGYLCWHVGIASRLLWDVAFVERNTRELPRTILPGTSMNKWLHKLGTAWVGLGSPPSPFGL